MTLWCLRGTDESELRVVELARCQELARLLYRGGEAAQVADARQICQTIHDLADARLRAHLAADEVARRQGRLHADGDDRGFQNLVNVTGVDDILHLATGLPEAVVDLLRQGCLHILDDLRAEQIAEQITDEVTGQLHLLVGIGVAVVVRHFAREDIQHLLRDERDVARLLEHHGRAADVGETLLRQHLANRGGAWWLGVLERVGRIRLAAAAAGSEICREPLVGLRLRCHVARLHHTLLEYHRVLSI